MHDAVMFNFLPNSVNHCTPQIAGRSFIIVAAVAAICFTGCSRDEATVAQRPVAPKSVAAVAAPVHAEPAIEIRNLNKTRATELMQAIFGDKYHAGEGIALVAIEDGENAGYWRMTQYAANELPDGRTAVVVNGAPSDENGADNAAHASPGMLNVYTLRRIDGAWQVIARHQDVSTMGSSGNIGVVKWIMLGPRKSGIIVSSGGTWFGSTIATANVFDIDHGMRNLGGFDELSSNAGGCMLEKADCWDVEGKIGTVPSAHAGDYRDIVVNFAGKHFHVTENSAGDPVEHVTRTIRQTARYRFNGKTYVLVAGENPVPAIDG